MNCNFLKVFTLLYECLTELSVHTWWLCRLLSEGCKTRLDACPVNGGVSCLQAAPRTHYCVSLSSTIRHQITSPEIGAASVTQSDTEGRRHSCNKGLAACTASIHAAYHSVPRNPYNQLLKLGSLPPSLSLTLCLSLSSTCLFPNYFLL